MPIGEGSTKVAQNTQSVASSRGRKRARKNEQRSLSPARSNSRERKFTEDGQKIDNPLLLENRRSVGTRTDHAIHDQSKVAIISFEASHNFAGGFARRQENAIIGKSKSGSISAIEAAREEEFTNDVLSARRTIDTKGAEMDVSRRIEFALKGKELPHVIAVIEGEFIEEELDLEIGDVSTSREKCESTFRQARSVKFKRVFKRQGKTKIGTGDAKQNITMFVREGMSNFYNFENADVKPVKGGGSISTPGVAINFETENGNKYQHIITHLPNDLRKSPKFAIPAMVAHAGTLGKRTLVAVSGDLNFHNEFQPGSAPSVGGVLQHDLKKRQFTLSPASSSAKRDTNFIQSIPIAQGTSHTFFQPAALPQVLDSKKSVGSSKIASDHPSIMTFVAFDSPLAELS
ncbi:hypothetical protein [Pseudophaeobacter sp.]|uniref:hypothetical protein n=1 Tax=Pseudophaeobacter sp. TaxID=1971739 RepID=UPI003299E643